MNKAIQYQYTTGSGRNALVHFHAIKHMLFTPVTWRSASYRPMVDAIEGLTAHYTNPHVLATEDKSYTWTSNYETHSRPNALVAVAYHEGIAYGACVLHGTQMYLYVHPDHRRRGIATALIDALRTRYNTEERVVIVGVVRSIVEFRRQSHYPGRDISHARRIDRRKRKVNDHVTPAN